MNDGFFVDVLTLL